MLKRRKTGNDSLSISLSLFVITQGFGETGDFGTTHLSYRSRPTRATHTTHTHAQLRGRRAQLDQQIDKTKSIGHRRSDYEIEYKKNLRTKTKLESEINSRANAGMRESIQN